MKLSFSGTISIIECQHDQVLCLAFGSQELVLQNVSNFRLGRKRAAKVLARPVKDKSMTASYNKLELEKVNRLNSVSGSPETLFMNTDRLGRIT